MLHLIKNEQGEPIGWEMVPTNDEERDIITTIRDLQFFGFEDTAIDYNGLQLIDPEQGKSYENLKSISWLMRKYQNK